MNIPTDSTISPTRTAMTVGAIIGAAMVIAPMLPGLSQWAQFISLGIFIGGIYYGMKRFRSECGGYASYGRLLLAGAQTAFFVSVILAFVMYITTKVIDPSLMDTYLEATKSVLQSTKMPSGMVDSKMQEMSQMISPAFLAFSTIFSYSLIGGIVACVCGLFLKTPEQPGQQKSQS